MCKHQQRLGLDAKFSDLVYNFNNIFSNEHLYRAGRSMNSLPSQIPERCVLLLKLSAKVVLKLLGFSLNLIKLSSIA